MRKHEIGAGVGGNCVPVQPARWLPTVDGPFQRSFILTLALVLASLQTEDLSKYITGSWWSFNIFHIEHMSPPTGEREGGESVKSGAAHANQVWCYWAFRSPSPQLKPWGACGELLLKQFYLISRACICKILGTKLFGLVSWFSCFGAKLIYCSSTC